MSLRDASPFRDLGQRPVQEADCWCHIQHLALRLRLTVSADKHPFLRADGSPAISPEFKALTALLLLSIH